MSDKTREDVEILGVNHTLAIDPDSLNEAGVVWTPAVRALASAVAPIVVAEAEARRSSSAFASASSAVDSSTDRALTTRILELGAGTGALGIALACAVPDVDVTLTDLDRVVPLMRTNADATRDAGKLARGSELRVAELAWSRDAVLGLDDAPGGGGGDRRDGGARWDVVLGCEILYWGGWDVFADDTRGPLLEACVAACEARALTRGAASASARYPRHRSEKCDASSGSFARCLNARLGRVATACVRHRQRSAWSACARSGARAPFATPSSKASVRGPARFAREANCAVTIRAPAYCSAEAAGAKPASR